MRPRKRRIRKMTTIVTISPIIPVGPRISSPSFPRESQRAAAARSALSPSWVGGRHAAQYSTRRDGSARQLEPSAVVPDESSCFNIGDIESLPLSKYLTRVTWHHRTHVSASRAPSARNPRSRARQSYLLEDVGNKRFALFPCKVGSQSSTRVESIVRRRAKTGRAFRGVARPRNSLLS